MAELPGRPVEGRDDVSEPLRIVLADDHQLVRQGVRALLQAEADSRWWARPETGWSRSDMVERLRPDLLVADLMMPGLGGLELTRQALRRSPRTRVVILTMHAAEPFVREALDHGASAYVLKDAGIAELVRAIRETALGRRYLSPPLSDRAVAAYARRARAAGPGAIPTSGSRPGSARSCTWPPRGWATPRSPSGSGSACARPRPTAPACGASSACGARPSSSGGRCAAASSRSTARRPRGR